MKTAQAIVEILKREGVEFVIGYPVNPILEFAARADVRPIIVRQERTGLHMADAVSRVTSGRRIGVFAMQHGPGSENAFGGVAQAWADSVPIVVLPMGYPRRTTNIPPNFNSTLNFRHITKWAEQVPSGAEVQHVMRRAFTQVRNGRPGPVLVEVPMDVFGEDSPEIDYRPAPRHRSAPDPAAVAAAADALLEAKRPVVYAGQGIHYAEAWEELRRFAELLALPVSTSLQGKSAFPEGHRLALGAGGRTLPEPVHHFLAHADLVLGVGCSFSATDFGVKMPNGKLYIHATLDPTDVNKDLESSLALLGDAKLTLEALLGELSRRAVEPRDPEPVAREIAEVKARWLERWRPKRESDQVPLNPYRVLAELRRLVDPDRVIITHDSGSPRDQLSPFWESTRPLSYIGWGKSTQLGYGLGLAMGAKLARPDQLCINVWGDAAIGFTGMDFETAVRERIPILSILLNNFSMAIELPIMKVSTEKYGATNITGDYAAMARAFGGYGERVTEPDQIAPAIRRGIAETERGVPALIEFLTSKEIEYSTFK
ncbi:MAG TPA: thiamine pyrophosphate-requiring protein [Thermoanaerobaculia bacterium]|nr:thiamine pyrophosphate-requiring protein [Thermoanaerobaculia bacterium]